MTPAPSQGLARRDLLASLLVLTAGTALPNLAQAAGPIPGLDGLDHAAVARIGKAWLEQNPGTDARALESRLFPKGRNGDVLTDLRRRAATDFRQGAVFNHRGWRLSQTEGALFGLLALKAEG